MRKYLLACALALISVITIESIADAQLRTPVLSPRSTLTQVVGVADVTIDYSRPSMRGRKIMGGLVPFGVVWRTGANASTKISFTDDAMLDGNKVPAGEYALYTLPGKDEWAIILSKNLGAGGNYPEGEDVIRFAVKPMKSSETIQSFTIDITDLKQNSANVQLAWENTVVKFKMEFDADTKIMSEIDKAMADMQQRNANVYFQAANYYFGNGKDMQKALQWVNKSIELNEGPFFVLRLKSRILAELKDYKAAIETAELSKAKAQEAGNQQFVKFNEDAIAEWKKKME
jgi:tetratricopeptide (TPR) repeat protein